MQFHSDLALNIIKVKALLFVLIFYFVASLITIAIGFTVRFLHPLLMILIADITATIVILTRGLWNYSRYLNYFGEILFWWGLYIFRLSADISYYWGIIGSISITILFNVISIP